MLVWQLDNGEYLVDDDNNFMHVFCSDQDPAVYAAAKKALTEAAQGYGFPNGKPVFWAGRRPIDDDELGRQLARAAAGLTPDPLDIGAIKDDIKELQRDRRGY